MAYTDKAQKIRYKLKRFTRRSVFDHIIQYLHLPENTPLSTAKKMLWLPFLLLEWLFQIEENPNSRPATKQQIMSLLNQMNDLQGDASNLEGSIDIHLTLRRMVIGQQWAQEHHIEHWFTLTRLHTLTMAGLSRNYFERSFLEVNGYPINDFFIMSLWILIHAQKAQTLSYEKLIMGLTPHFSIQTVIKFLDTIGASLDRLETLLKSSIDTSIQNQAYFAETRMLNHPLIYLEEVAVIPHRTLVTKSLSEFVSKKLRSANASAFMQRFSTEFERYVGIVINEYNHENISEREIIDLYEANSLEGKVTDFILTGNQSLVMLEAKGVGPHERVKVLDNPRLIKHRLRDLWEGVRQSFGCLKLMTENRLIDHIRYQERYAVVVTYKDFNISRAKAITDRIAPDLLVKLHEDFGDYIPISNIYFMSINEFEGAMKACSMNNQPLSHFLEYCVIRDSCPETQSFAVSQHISAYMKAHSQAGHLHIGCDYIMTSKDQLFDDLANTVLSNERYWRRNGTSALGQYFQAHNELKKALGLSPQYVSKK